MKLVQVGDVWINFDQVAYIKNSKDICRVYFTAASSDERGTQHVPSVSFKGQDRDALLAYLATQSQKL